ncbi:hypothetical protein PUW24_20860 [Paenibacillus urinalis]|nr:hypothetical protein [Paenibacillus urinalis]WDH96589.1 hypothetical protein PUW24_20860 [Paenibacillus urinalis]
MNEAHGTTIILCSHVLQQLESLCHSYIFLSNGTILDTGTKEELDKKHFKTVQLRLTTGLSIEEDRYHGYPVQRVGPSEILLELPSTDLISTVLRQILEETWVHTAEIMNRDLESLYFQVKGEK